MAAPAPSKDDKKKMAFRLGAKGKSKTNNNEKFLKGKIELRRNVLAAIGAKDANVLDAFAGSGEMYSGVWKDAASYVGCDREFYRDERTMYVVDNRRLMRAIDLNRFNVFDLDAYGSPWEHALILAARRIVKPGERIGVIITDGGGMASKLGAFAGSYTLLTGYVMAQGMARSYRRFHLIGVQKLASKMRCDLERHWVLPGARGEIFYSGFILKGWG